MLVDSDGPVSETCLYHCAPGVPAPCDEDGCGCPCHDDAARARQLDDRPDTALANVARDLEAEARPSVEELAAERYGRPTRGRA